MVDGDLYQGCVFGLLRRIKDNPHVHHDIYEDAVLGYERPEVSALGLKAKGQSFSCINDYLIFSGVAREVIPRFTGRQE